MDIAAFLGDLGLERYAPAFLENAVDEESLLELSEADLAALGVLLGHRKKLMKAIRARRSAREIQADRRQVAVLFADLSGFTALSNQMDAEDVHAMLEGFFAHVDAIVIGHGGHVDKHIGDCVMGVFGAPMAHGDDARRAALAALAITRSMPALSRRLGLPMAVHVGIAFGQVVASGVGAGALREYTVTGDTVNLASRLTDAARSGEILVSDEVRRALDGFECTQAGAMPVRGFSEPVPTWRLGGLAGGADSRTPFVGRAAELERLEAVLGRCRATGRGQLVHVRGEAGIGKTRLVQEVLRRAEAAGAAVAAGQVLDYGAGEGAGAVEAVAAAALGIPAGAGRDVAQEAVATAVSAGLVRPGDALFLNELLGLPQPPELRAVRQALDEAARARGRRRALKRLVERSSARRPQLILVEDLHAADEATLAAAASLAFLGRERAVVLMTTSRIESDPIASVWLARAGDPPATIIDLGPLPAGEAAALARRLTTADEGTTTACVARSGGNPLFLEQLLQHAGEGAGAGVPGSVQSLVQARLDRLAAADRAALQAAAVLGHGFSREELDQMVGAPYDPEPLLARLFLRRRGERLGFAHALIRDAVYGTLLKSRRRTLHRRAAALFAGRNARLHAEHLTLAEDPAAADANLAAARAEADEHHHEAALKLAERALDVAAAPAQRFAAHSLLGRLRFQLGDIPQARSAAEKAVQLSADGGERASALIDLAAIRRTTDDVEGALAALAEAEGLAAAAGLTAEAARLHQLRATVLFPRGEIDRCLAENLKSLELARLAGSPELEAGALGGLGDAEYMRGRMASALARFRHAVEVCREHGFGRIEVATLPMLALAEVFAATAAEALASARAAIALARAVGPRYEEIIAHQSAILCYGAVGDHIAAANHAEKALSLARHLGARRFQAECLALRAGLHCRAGRRARARADASQALAICRRGEAMRYIGPTVLGVLAMASDDRRGRERALEEGEAALPGSVSHNHFWFLRDGIEVRLMDGDRDGALRYAGMLEDFAGAEPLPWSDFYIARARALTTPGPTRRSLLAAARQAGDRLGLAPDLAAIDLALKA